MIINQGIRQYGKTHNVPITLDDTLCFLLDIINKNKFKQILEIGTAIGYGSIAMATNTTAEHIDTVEIDKDRFDMANKNIKDCELEEKISTNLSDAMEYLKSCKKKYDFIYLDGPKGQYINYLPYAEKLLNENGIIFADNLYFHGMVTGSYPVSRNCRSMIKGLRNYINEITTNPKYDTVIYDIGDGVGVTKLKPLN